MVSSATCLATQPVLHCDFGTSNYCHVPPLPDLNRILSIYRTCYHWHPVVILFEVIKLPLSKYKYNFLCIYILLTSKIFLQAISSCKQSLLTYILYYMFTEKSTNFMRIFMYFLMKFQQIFS